MSRNKQQRPTRHEFEAAALRFEKNNYPDWWESSLAAHAIVKFGSIFTLRPAPPRRINMRKSDRLVLKTEQRHEGYIIGEENLAAFAKNQLARYRVLEKQ